MNDPDKSDNRIIAAALGLNQSHPNVTVVSNDTTTLGSSLANITPRPKKSARVHEPNC